MNLIHDPWLPIRRRDGTCERITPWQITDQHDSNPIITLNLPRADFNGSLTQFLIGLLQSTTNIERRKEWRRLLANPPTPDELRTQFAPTAGAFELGGEGPRFMQDFDQALPGEANDINALLIEAPGGNTLKNNIDLFIKRGRVKGMCPPCAAAALYTLQTNAPSGGVGHRTSLRGGGPLTTLVMFDPKAAKDQLEATLWRNVWMNVLYRPNFLNLSGNSAKTDLADIFPWLGPTRTSEAKTGQTTPEDAHPAQMFWGMPRRIRLNCEPTYTGNCDICGDYSKVLITRYIAKNYGINYTGPWKHPLSPHTRDKQGNPLPRHAQPGGVGYRHWLGLVLGDGKNREEAKVVSVFLDRRLPDAQFIVWAFGYDMDNMKARAWYESKMPLYQLEDANHHREDFAITVQCCISGANETRGYLVSALKQAWFERPADVKGDMSFLDIAFWQNTEATFYDILHDLVEALSNGEDAMMAMNMAKENWYKVLYQQVVALFDLWAASSAFECEDPRRVAQAYNGLKRNMSSKLRRVLDLPKKPAVSKPQGEHRDATASV